MSSTGCTRRAAPRRSIPTNGTSSSHRSPRPSAATCCTAYRKRLTSDDADVQLAAAKAFSAWEANTVTVLPNAHVMEEFTEPHKAISIARIENHYMVAKGWLEEGQLLANAGKLKGIPGIIVQGRHDTCTPPRAAWQLKQAWPEVDLQIVPDGGHLYSEPGILDGLVRATDYLHRGQITHWNSSKKLVKPAE